MATTTFVYYYAQNIPEAAAWLQTQQPISWQIVIDSAWANPRWASASGSNVQAGPPFVVIAEVK